MFGAYLEGLQIRGKPRCSWLPSPHLVLAAWHPPFLLNKPNCVLPQPKLKTNTKGDITRTLITGNSQNHKANKTKLRPLRKKNITASLNLKTIHMLAETVQGILNVMSGKVFTWDVNSERTQLITNLSNFVRTIKFSRIPSQMCGVMQKETNEHGSERKKCIYLKIYVVGKLLTNRYVISTLRQAEYRLLSYHNSSLTFKMYTLLLSLTWLVFFGGTTNSAVGCIKTTQKKNISRGNTLKNIDWLVYI